MLHLSIQVTILKVNHYRSRYGLQHGAYAHTEQQAIKGPTITSVKLFKGCSFPHFHNYFVLVLFFCHLMILIPI